MVTPSPPRTRKTSYTLSLGHLRFYRGAGLLRRWRGAGMSVETRRPPSGWNTRLPPTLPLHLWAAWPPGRDSPGRTPASRGRGARGRECGRGLLTSRPGPAPRPLRRPPPRLGLPPAQCLLHVPRCGLESPREAASRSPRTRPSLSLTAFPTRAPRSRAHVRFPSRVRLSAAAAAGGPRRLDGRPWRRTGPESR